MSVIEDLSWSGIVDQIQGDNTKGAEIIYEIASEKEQLDSEIVYVERKLQRLEKRRSLLKAGALLVVM